MVGAADALATALDQAAEQLGATAAKLRTRPLVALVDQGRLLLIAGPLLAALQEVDRQAVHVAGFTMNPALQEPKP